MKRKLLSVVLALCMVLTLMAAPVAAAYQDTEGHWAESSIERWTGHGIVQGTENGFDPDGELTCAQLAAILARLLKLPEAPDAGFSDNPAEAWYFDSVNRCAAAGILLGNGDGTVTPNAPITRERAIVMLSRALGIEPVENPDLSAFEDADAVADYAQGYVAALVAAGVIKGVTDETVGPQLNITRAATVAILDRAIAVYADTEGAEIDASEGGFILVAAENVAIKNAPAGTKVLVTPSADGLTVNGKKVESDQTYVVPENKPTPTVPTHSHSYDTSKWVVDDTYHWHAANCGHDLTIDKAEHSFGDDGICTVCGQLNSSMAVAQINGQNYAALAAAIAAAAAGDTVTLVDDVTQNTSVTVEKSITLDLNGKKIANTEDIWHDADENVEGDVNIVAMFSIESGAKVTITGDGEIAAKENDCYTFNVMDGSKLTIENGKFVGNVSVVQVQEGTLTVNGGAFSLLQKWGGSSKYLLNCIDAAYKDGSAKIVVKGGEFVDYNPSASASENPPANFVAAGYKATENNGTWTVEKITAEEAAAGIGDVYYLTLADAVAAAAAGDTVTLVSDNTTLTSSVEINKSITLDLNGKTLTANIDASNAAIQVDGSNAALTIKDSVGSGKITSTGYGIYPSEGAAVTVESGTIESLYCPLSGNNTTGSMNFTVKGGTLTAQKGPAIYMPGQVNLVITGGTLNGGISLRMGQVNISGGTINAVTSDIDAPSSFYNYSGNAWLPDALYVFGGTYANGDEAHGNSLKLTITGGMFNCSNSQGSAVAIYDLGKVAQTMDVKISGDAALTTNATGRGAYQVLSLSDIGVNSPAAGYGNTDYTGKVSSAITGGTFSSDPSAYVAAGCTATENNDGTWTVA